MKYQPLHDLIDPDVPAQGAAVEPPQDDPDAPNDAYEIGAHGHTLRAPDARAAGDVAGKSRAWVKPAAILLSLACVGLTVWNLARLIQGPPTPPKPTPFQVRQALYLGVLKVEAYRRVHGVTPSSLADASLPDPGPYSYQRLNPGHYVLGFQADGPREQYDSAIPMERVFGSPEKMLAMGGAQ